jgi:hypothetical protein
MLGVDLQGDTRPLRGLTEPTLATSTGTVNEAAAETDPDGKRSGARLESGEQIANVRLDRLLGAKTGAHQPRRSQVRPRSTPAPSSTRLCRLAVTGPHQIVEKIGVPGSTIFAVLTADNHGTGDPGHRHIVGYTTTTGRRGRRAWPPPTTSRRSQPQATWSSSAAHSGTHRLRNCFSRASQPQEPDGGSRTRARCPTASVGSTRTSAIRSQPANEAPYRLIDEVEVGHAVVVSSFTNLYGCQIGDETRIGPFVEIQRGVVIGARCKIQSHNFICTRAKGGGRVFRRLRTDPQPLLDAFRRRRLAQSARSRAEPRLKLCIVAFGDLLD